MVFIWSLLNGLVALLVFFFICSIGQYRKVACFCSMHSTRTSKCPTCAQQRQQPQRWGCMAGCIHAVVLQLQRGGSGGEAGFGLRADGIYSARMGAKEGLERGMVVETCSHLFSFLPASATPMVPPQNPSAPRWSQQAMPILTVTCSGASGESKYGAHLPQDTRAWKENWESLSSLWCP